MKFNLTLIIVISSLILGCTNEPKDVPPIRYMEFERINSIPHDINSFTEGLLVHNDKLYESTGATAQLPQTRSLFGSVSLSTGKINIKAELDKNKYFGEGFTFFPKSKE
jgi:glutamine cyclotransferase